MKGKIAYVLILFFGMINIVGCFKNDMRESSTVITPPGITTPTCAGTAGPLFTAMKTLVTAKCVSCHNNFNSNGGINFSIECNIVINQSRIKIRAVDQGSMPPSGTLPAADKATITKWINAGGKYTD